MFPANRIFSEEQRQKRKSVNEDTNWYNFHNISKNNWKHCDDLVIKYL